MFLLGKVPLRLSMGGGGTDLSGYSDEEGGFWTSAAINKYVHLAVNLRWDGHWVVQFSERVQRVADISEIEHPITREVLLHLEADKHELLKQGLEIHIVSDAPTKSGLGVSGAITVNLLQIIRTMKGEPISLKELAEEAYYVEHDRCDNKAIGRQDHYIAAFGGITSFKVTRGRRVSVHPLNLDLRTRIELMENLVLFGTGITRPKSAEETLREQGLSTAGEQKLSKEKIAYLRRIKRIGIKQWKAMRSGKIRQFGELLGEHWQTKILYSGHRGGSLIDKIYEAAKQAGAIGGKSIGAGTEAPFMLFYVEPNRKASVRDAMASYGLQEVPWFFEERGSRVAFDD